MIIDRDVLQENIMVKGIGVSSGLAIGKVYLLDTMKSEIISYCLINDPDIEEEIERFKNGVSEAKKQLLKVKDEILSREHKETVYIIDAQLMILDDKMLFNDTIGLIKEQKINAEWAFELTLKKIKDVFEEVGDKYLKERQSDIDYVGERIMKNLLGKKIDTLTSLTEKAVVIAHDLSPADTAQMVNDRVLGFATDIGGKTSHTAIIARSLEIPAVVGLENVTKLVRGGDTVVVDGIAGVVIIKPSQDILKSFEEKKEVYEKQENELIRYRELPAITKDGYRVTVAANISFKEEMPSILDHGTEGIGLYRTEFLYLGKKELPTEEEHFQTYKSVVEGVYPNPVTIRTLDIGGDKFVSRLDLAEEMNPAMGLRAIRFCLKEVDIFKTQLKAILRASKYGNMRILFPMISGLPEIVKVKEILEETKNELRVESKLFEENIKIGIMIEIPSAVTMADLLAKEVDFFSIGTNDLIQYTLAIDRVNERVNYLYEPLHPAVLRAIRHVVECGHQFNIEVSMCGEMAGEPLYVPILLGMGIDELSMNALSIPKVKKFIRGLTIKECKEMFDEVFKFSSAYEIQNFVEGEMAARFPEEFFIIT